MTRLRKSNYWDRIVNYYYDHVWRTTDQTPEICEWMKQEYNVDASRQSDWMEFSNAADATVFALRWI